MAKPQKVNTEETTANKGNIENLAALAQEYKSNKMPEKKLVALRMKLVGLFLEGKITEDEQELMEAILRKERNLARITSRDNYLLNRIEADRCEDTCIVKTDDVPTVHHLFKDLECKFAYDSEYNDGKGKKDSVGRFYVYVPRTVPTRHQLTISTVEKEIRGHAVDEKEYPAPKVLIHRLALKDSEFRKWFDVQDENILSAAPQEPVYQF